jgi:hypothetical protein
VPRLELPHLLHRPSVIAVRLDLEVGHRGGRVLLGDVVGDCPEKT